MVTELTMGSTVLYSHTAWADDPDGTGFSLTEYEDALYCGNYVDTSDTDSSDPERYEWRIAENPDDASAPETTYDALMTDVLSDLEDVTGDIENTDANIEGTQGTSDIGLGNVNELIGTNKGTEGWTASGSIVLTAQSEKVYADTDESIDILSVTCQSAGSSHIMFHAEELRGKLSEDTPDNAYTFSCDLRMSELFDIPVIAVQNPDGTGTQIRFDAYESVEEAGLDEVDLSGSWIHHTSTASVLGNGEDPVEASSQGVFFDLSEMPVGAVLDIANLKIEGGGLATPWRESLSEIKAKADRALSTAEEAKADALAAHTAAQNAAADAASAAQSASSASISAGNAASSASAAQSSAQTAASSASSAQNSASQSSQSATNAAASAGMAAQSASEAASSAGTASQSAQQAQAEADTARRNANSALTQLSVVEDVVGTLTWLSEHGEFVETEDTEPDPDKRYYERIYDYLKTEDTSVVAGKTYYTRSGEGTDVSPYVYTEVANPSSSHLDDYYEYVTTGYDYYPMSEGDPSYLDLYELKSVDEALTNFIGTHLALTESGLWVIRSDDTDYRILIASDGLYVYGPDGVISKFGENIEFSSDMAQRLGGQNSYIRFNPAEGSTPETIDIVADSIRIGARDAGTAFESTESRISAAESIIQTQQTRIEEQQDAIDTLNGYVDINTAEGYIRVGKRGADSFVQIDGTDMKVAINIDGRDVAYMSGDRFYAPSAVVSNLYMKTDLSDDSPVGALGWVMRSNGHLSLKRIR